MRRWILMLAAVLLFSLLPSGGTELGELRPVGVLYINMEDKNIVVKTDTEDSGQGETLDAAFLNLSRSSVGHVFLDTAEDLILSEESVFLLSQLRECLRPGVRVCISKTEPDLEAAYAYLHTHVPGSILAETDAQTTLPRLNYEGERFTFEQQ